MTIVAIPLKVFNTIEGTMQDNSQDDVKVCDSMTFWDEKINMYITFYHSPVKKVRLHTTPYAP